MKRRVLGLLLAAVLLLGMVTPAFAAEGLDNFQKSKEYANQFTDVPADSWFAENVKVVYEYGLMTGTSQTTFNPTGVLSVAEAIVIAYRLHSVYHQAFSDVSSTGAWYQGYVQAAQLARLTEGMEFSDYTAPATRAQMAQIFARTVYESDLPAINRINYIPDVPREANYSKAVYLLYNAGILTGSDDQGSFRPESSITRAEVAAIVTRIVDASLRREFTLPNQSEFVPDPALTMSETVVSMKIGEQRDVSVRKNPEYITGYPQYVWTISDPSVAELVTMDDLVIVLARGEGTAEVTVTVEGHSASFMVVVAKTPITDVQFEKNEEAVKVGNTKYLPVAIQPEDASAKTLVWTSSDPSVATVSQDGNVTGVAEGIATITVHGDGVSDSCIVNVYEKLVIQVVLLPAHSVLPLGRTGELTAGIVMMEETVVPVRWTSSDPSIVTVDSNGVVTGVSVGRATITVTVEGISASCVVDVQEIPIGLENFTRSKEYQDQFKDVAAGWYYESVKNAYEYGLMTGTGADTFNPGGQLTIAETLAIACRIHNTYYGSLHQFEAGSPWYQPYVDYALLYGLVGVDEYSDYTVKATRADFAAILARSVPEEALPAINEFEMVPDVDVEADYAYSVYLLYWAGVLSGSDAYGSFNPDSTITRAEVAAIVTRIVDPALRKTFTLENHPAKYYYEDVLELRNTIYNGVLCAQQAMNQMNHFLNQTDGSRYNSLQYAYTQFGYSLGSMKMALATMEAKDPIYLEDDEYETLADFARSICTRIEGARGMSYTQWNINERFGSISEKYSEVYNDYVVMYNLFNRLVSEYQ